MDMQKLIKQINTLLQEAKTNSNCVVVGYDEGWYCGEVNAYKTVLHLLKNFENV